MAIPKLPSAPWTRAELEILGKKGGQKSDYMKAVPVLILEIWEQRGGVEGEEFYVRNREIRDRIERSGLRSFPPKGSSNLLSALTRRQGTWNLTRPPLCQYRENGVFWVNLPEYERLLQDYRQWYSAKYKDDYERLFPSVEQPHEVSSVSEMQSQDAQPTLGETIRSLEQYNRAWQERLKESERRVKQLEQDMAHWRQRICFVHTSPDFSGTTYDGKVTSIQETIQQMLRGAKSSVRISTRQMDMFEDKLIRLKEHDPTLSITVLSRGPNKAEGDRRAIAGRAFDRMKAAGIKLPVETDLLHSRMVIVDEREVLVSSADLDYTQMEKEFNAGIWTSDPDVAAAATCFFDNLLQSPTIKGG